MPKHDGYMGKVLTIDLKDKTTSLYPWSEEDRELYLGGKITAAKIISDNVKPCVDAFHDAKNLWGKTTSQTQQALDSRAGKVVIGPAGLLS